MSVLRRCKTRLLVVATLTAITALSGCSTPYALRWQGGAPTAASSMPAAMAELHGLRQQYRTAVSAHLNDERRLGNVLVGTGSLVLALALGGAHRDAIAGTSLLAGTGYTLGSTNLQRPRLLVYQAGVEALNCVERAAAPLVTGDDAQGVQEDVRALGAARTAVATAIAAGQPVRAQALKLTGSGRISTEVAEFDAATTDATSAVQASTATLDAGLALLAASRRAARQLLAAVNGVHDAVQRSLITATPDLSAVPGLVSGLAGTAAAFAPGAGLETIAAKKLEESLRNKAQSTPAAPTAVQAATLKLEAATLVLVQAHSTLADALQSHSAAWPADAFKDCGVMQVVAALTVDPVTARFTVGADGRRTLDISGGVKPYFVEFDGEAIDGLTLRAPMRFDSRIELLASGDKLKKTAQTTLRVVDSSPAGKAVRVPISVAPAMPPVGAAAAGAVQDGTGKPAGGTTTGTAGTKPGGVLGAGPIPQPPAIGPVDSAALNSALEALKRKDTFVLAGKTYTRTGIPTRQGAVLVAEVRCPAGAVTTRAALASAYLSEAGAPLAVAGQLRVLPDPAACAPQ